MTPRSPMPATLNPSIPGSLDAVVARSLVTYSENHDQAVARPAVEVRRPSVMPSAPAPGLLTAAFGQEAR
ncbi:hypothetical protein [Allobranchiibius sp. GilTou38]|uniref:hypothetical protein n=1 Tax=Allobranchiibius sp. GilTou38 TaxID=2815210 RepID=UPI001AA0E32C|nr:hypothetical protein [Allobranchiibius sp. GilTou38]MBO1768373.1 hypothetical protein [Allobranchiibius sp. GilTou38]